jgi:hypothetical protein
MLAGFFFQLRRLRAAGLLPLAAQPVAEDLLVLKIGLISRPGKRHGLHPSLGQPGLLQHWNLKQISNRG